MSCTRLKVILKSFELIQEYKKTLCRFSCYLKASTVSNDISLLAELLELLVPAVETMASEAASLGLEVNWQKINIQALGCSEDMPLTIKVQAQVVMVVDRSSFTLAVLFTQQLEALVTSAAEVPSLMLPCRA